MHNLFRCHVDNVLAIAMIILSALAISLSDALIKLNSADTSIGQLYVLRSLFALPLLLLIMMARGHCQRPEGLGWLICRSLLMAVMWAMVYAALPALSLSVVAAGVYTFPLFMALFMACSRKGRWSPRTLLAVLTGFGGVLVMLRPGVERVSWQMLLPLSAAACYALAALVTRYRCRQEHALMLSLGLNLAFLLTGLGMLLLFNWWPLQADLVARHAFIFSGWHATNISHWVLAAALGGLIVIASITMALAYQRGQPLVIATFDYSYLVFVVLWGVVLLGEHPDFFTLTGMLLIMGAGLLTLLPARARRQGTRG
ncbi:DMT family transporter [Kushneria indalinina]|uniref:EamA domain-containing protein n=1 Tax=Kushneria indalinina DSM 14324 TaxID=1122140 RepID=A0A3D9DSU4_9GAMM|nr:DMT family transporter [Kushneria indalinina]REC93850.1 hypothetical protein C8D72_3199 [Kushneria indalinina DSM 14324]